MPDSQVFDLDYLRRQTAGDQVLERDLVALFEAQCARLAPAVRQGGSSVQRADAAHTLKGSAKAIGAWRLASVADRLETDLRNAEAGADSLIAILDETIEATRRALAKHERASAA